MTKVGEPKTEKTYPTGPTPLSGGREIIGRHQGLGQTDLIVVIVIVVRFVKYDWAGIACDQDDEGREHHEGE